MTDADRKPIEPPSSGPFLTKALGIGFMILGVGAVILMRFLLPPWQYPNIVLAIPAVPFVLLAWRCFQKVGWGTEAPEVDPAVLIQPDEAVEARGSRMSKRTLWLVGFAILFALLFAVAYFSN